MEFTTNLETSNAPQKRSSHKAGLLCQGCCPQKSQILAVLALTLFCIGLRAEENSLSIPSAGIQQADDSSFVPPDYQFLPGETVFFTFEIAGFLVRSEEGKETRTISLTWDVSALDSNNVLLAKPESGEIKTELSAEDRKWTPKRRTAFALPVLVLAGDYHLRVVAKDLLGKSEAVREIPFRIGGLEIASSASIAVQHMRFSREESGPALDVAAYRPGDTVFTSFDITGFAKSPENQYRVSYGLSVLRPDGKTFVDQANAAELSATPFYPAMYVPGHFGIVTSATSPRGEYTLLLTVTDQIAHKTFSTKRAFSLE